MPSIDQAIELQDMRFQHTQLVAESCETRSRYLGHASVIYIGDDLKKLLNTAAPDRRHNPKLGKVSAERIGYRILLAYQEMTRAMEHQAALLLWRFDLNKPHRRPPDSFADRLRVRRIVLLSFDIRLHVGWRHQTHGMAQRLELTRPMVRRGTSLNAYDTWCKLLKERQNIATL